MSQEDTTSAQTTHHQAFFRSQSTDASSAAAAAAALHLGHAQRLTHSSTLPTLTAHNSLLRANFQRRTNQLRDNINNVIREFQPLVDSARSVLNRPQSEPNIPVNNGNNEQDNSFVINLVNNHQQQVNNQATLEVDEPVEANNPPGNEDEVANNVEAQQAINLLQRYVPFAFILIAKCIYDHQEGLLNLIVLLAIFTHANSVVKKEATKRTRRSLSRLFVALLYIVIGVLFIHYIFDEERLYLNLIFIRTYDKPLTVWDLLWFVGITDFILKLITVMVKIVLTMLPAAVVPFQKRGKIYLFIEAISQLYRSLAPIQPWLFYLLESYEGTEKIVGVFLSAAYMVSKGADLMSKLKFIKLALFKLIQNVTVGSSPSKEQIQTAGEQCPICHDTYESPVLLQCRHIFCESCVTTWFDREQTCPLCRSKIVDDPSWRDGSTSFFLQLF